MGRKLNQELFYLEGEAGKEEKISDSSKETGKTRGHYQSKLIHYSGGYDKQKFSPFVIHGLNPILL
jgi:hypothetical protein